MSLGALPAGTAPGDEAAAARSIREMFSRVAPRYDLLNLLLSARIDRSWRGALVRRTGSVLARPEARCLDLCCGTGDVLLAIERERERLCGAERRPAAGSDFCRPMLDGAARKTARRGVRCPLFEADALRVPLRDHSLDLITVAFGFRNLTNYRAGLEEFHRLLAPGGVLAILEFSRPSNPLWRPVFEFYFRRILPRIGNSLSGAGQAYSYLQSSVEQFWSAEELRLEMLRAGFARAEFTALTGGVSALHLASKESVL